MKDAWSSTMAAGVSARRRPPPLLKVAAIVAALALGVTTAFAGDESGAWVPAGSGEALAATPAEADNGGGAATAKVPATSPSPSAETSPTPGAVAASGADSSTHGTQANSGGSSGARSGAASGASPASANTAEAASEPAAVTTETIMVPPPAPGEVEEGLLGGPALTDSVAHEGAATAASSGSSMAADPKIATPTPPPAYNAPVLPADQQDRYTAPPGTTIIPPASPPPAGAQEAGADNSQVSDYQANQQMPLNEPQLHSLQEFMSEGVNASPLGIELQEGQRKLNGRQVDGLLVVGVQSNSSAAKAGIQAGHRAAHDVLEGAAVAASLVFPPAVLAVPVIETIQLGENYDMIIGVDGNRVTNFMDFEDQLRDAQPGETVYLNILRSGKRLQVPVKMPAQNAANLYP